MIHSFSLHGLLLCSVACWLNTLGLVASAQIPGDTSVMISVRPNKLLQTEAIAILPTAEWNVISQKQLGFQLNEISAVQTLFAGGSPKPIAITKIVLSQPRKSPQDLAENSSITHWTGNQRAVIGSDREIQWLKSADGTGNMANLANQHRFDTPILQILVIPHGFREPAKKALTQLPPSFATLKDALPSLIDRCEKGVIEIDPKATHIFTIHLTAKNASDANEIKVAIEKILAWAWGGVVGITQHKGSLESPASQQLLRTMKLALKGMAPKVENRSVQIHLDDPAASNAAKVVLSFLKPAIESTTRKQSQSQGDSAP